MRVQNAIAEFGALGAPGGLGLLLAAPTIAVHGTPEQKERYIRPIVTGQQAWCQLFSEPDAGSDLAGLQTRAERDGDEWVITGQKVWTSAGQIADLGMLLARTNPDVPKHQGITYFAFDMQQPGVEVRPLREMTGRALFNEVFITEARVSDAAIIGGTQQRVGGRQHHPRLRAGRARCGGRVGCRQRRPLPGSIAGDLARRAGDFVGPRARGGAGGPGRHGRHGRRLLADAGPPRSAPTRDPLVRQDLARLYTLTEIGRFMTPAAKGAARQRAATSRA